MYKNGVLYYNISSKIVYFETVTYVYIGGEKMANEEKELIKIQEQATEMYNKSIFNVSISIVILGALFCFLFYLCYDSYFDITFLNVMTIVVGILLVILVGAVVNDVKAKKMVKKDIKGFLESKYAGSYKVMYDGILKEQERENEQWEYDHPICPVCKSRNTKRITTASRMISVAAVGIASGKIGKQYECLKCKHKW